MHFQHGIVEGFYGRQWSWEERLSLPGLMTRWQLDCYIYAPKGDGSLRSQWQQPFSQVHFQRLKALGEAFHQHGLQWGLGLSPAGLQAQCSAADIAVLTAKLESIKRLQVDALWLLFDDLPAGNPELAANQLRVAQQVVAVLPEVNIAVCPSYYSFDPILEELFGRCPEGYFAALNEGLPEAVDLLWTGNKVVSDSITCADLTAATELLGRPPLLWDNYPVNDGRKTSRFLHLAPFSARGGIAKGLCRGHFSNPMNQFALNALPLATLRDVAASPDSLPLGPGLADLPGELKALLLRDWQAFQHLGLDGLDAAAKQQRLDEYRAIGHPMANEIVQWLGEAYRFDPNCLTE